MKTVAAWSLVILLSAALTANSAPELSDRIIIELPETYIVPKADQKVIQLGDVAEVKAPDEATRKRYESVIVLDAPEAGSTARLPNHYIIQAIRKANLDFTRLYFTGERIVEVFGFGKTLDIQTILQKMKKRVLEESGWKEDELVLRILSAPRNEFWIPPKPVDIILDRISPTLYGTVRYEVRLFIDNIQYKSFPILASIAHRRTAYLPSRTLKRGEVFGPDDIREVVQYFDQELMDKQAVDDPKEIIGSKCKTGVNKSDVIKWNNLDVNYVVNRGDLVKLIVNSGGLSMQTIGKALKRGAIGDIVLIKAEKTNHIVKARVIQRGLVELVTL
ncbi:MAG: flagellar basal body P-ring formation protein FlgA [Candidatus Omnitrophica bacterium]|nr:flagellar basal body P-ring formation protein FlgA [Candidatus Omnitrophota bacterium]